MKSSKKNIKQELSIKEYKKLLKETYKADDDYEKKMKALYENNTIKKSWKEKRIRYLLNTEKNFIGKLTLIISSLLSALITSVISSESINDVLKTHDISIIIKSFAFVLILMIVICLIIAGFTLIVTTPFVIGTISPKELKKISVEIDLIIKSMGKSSLVELFEKPNKKRLTWKFIGEILIGCIVSVIASVIIWFLP